MYVISILAKKLYIIVFLYRKGHSRLQAMLQSKPALTRLSASIPCMLLMSSITFACTGRYLTDVALEWKIGCYNSSDTYSAGLYIPQLRMGICKEIICYM